MLRIWSDGVAWVFAVILLAGCGASGTLPASLPPSRPMLSATATQLAEPSLTLSASEVLTATVTPDSPLVLADWPGMIAFYSDRDGNPEIYVLHGDGSQTMRLTDDPAFDDSPVLSPDGARIAFLTARHDPEPQFPNLKYEIYMMDSDGGNVQRLTATAAAEDHPAWSPEGNSISFDADYDGDGYYEIYTMAPDGTNVTRLTFNEANDQFADWSPDGAYIAFTSDRNGNWDIFVMDADGSNQRSLTSSPDWELFPAWSPDGTQIAFSGLVPGSRNTDVFVMRADGSEVRRLTDSPRFDENPVWSPDGNWIAFQTQRNGNFDLYVMRPDGDEVHPLTTQSSDELWPSWTAFR
ncbi:MAG: PD40 domain-containing protein [Anaerolineae bacterium]|nr:PD40 domain-containing protein [Anaerolineae bacterium]